MHVNRELNAYHIFSINCYVHVKIGIKDLKISFVPFLNGTHELL